MFNQLYSDVGFRCESVCIALNNFRQSKKINLLVYEDSKRIISDCLRIETKSSHSLFLSNTKTSEISSLLFDYIMEKHDKDVVDRLKRISSNINKINELNKDQYNEIVTFFDDLVNICKEKAQPLPRKDINNAKFNAVVV